MQFDSLVTQRLIIREHSPSDREAMLDFVRHPEQLGWMSIAFPTEQSLDDFLQFAARTKADEERQDYQLAVAERTSGRYVGSLALMREADAPFAAELGYFFLREHWGKGYAQEGCRALLEFGFETLGLHRIWGKCHIDNLASARVMAGIGMLHEGTLRQHIWQRDHYRTSHLYALLKSDWEASAQL